MLAGSTGLEPAASGVTGRRSNQLNYDPVRDLMILQISDFGFQIANSDWNLKSELINLKFRVLVLNGRYRARTCDSRRVKPVLYQLS